MINILRLLVFSLGALTAIACMYEPLISHAKSPSATPDFAFELRSDDCRPASDVERKWTDNRWDSWVDHVKTCALRLGEGAPILYLLSVWVDDYYGMKKGTPRAEEIPRPILLSSEGSWLGELPWHFPGEEATTLKVIFRSWRNGWPEYIDLFLFDMAVGGNRPLKEMRWNASKRVYE